jgi:TolB protein
VSSIARRLVALTAALAVLVAAAVASGAEAPQRIVFDRDGVVWTMRPDGTDQRQLHYGSFPAWSPDRTQVVYFSARSQGLFVLRADGSGLRRLTRGFDVEPAWSPDGTRIAFTRNVRGAGLELYVVGVRDGKVRRLTANRIQDTQPSWSPDSRYLAWARTAATRFARPQVWTMNADGTVKRFRFEGSQPDWSPDGRWFAFTSYDGRVGIHARFGVSVDYLAKGNSPNWSPDGDWLVFSSGENDRAERPDLFTVARDRSGRFQLTETPASENRADW